MDEARRHSNRLARAPLAGKAAATKEMRLAHHTYAVAGLRVTSDLPMPGLLTVDGTDASIGAPDVEIARAILAAPPATADDPLAEMSFELDGLMRMSMRHGATLLYDPVAGAPPDDIALYLGGTGFGTLLHQRGMVLLHASAVRIGDRAALFCGPSGAGKSTLAAALVDAGHDHIADDFCAIDFAADGSAMVAPDGRRHKLWDSAITGLAARERRGGAVRSDMAKYYVDPARVITRPIRIGAIFDLAVDDETNIEPLSALDIVTLVQANAYRPNLVALMQQQRLYFDAAVRLGRYCRFARLTRALNYGAMSEQIASIERAMAQPAQHSIRQPT